MTNSVKIDFITFCSNLKSKFPTLKNLSVWSEWDCSNEGHAHSVVMSDLAMEMINWAINGEYEQVKRFLNEIESSFEKGNDTVIAFLGTDFTVTILECTNKSVRETIKQLMGKETYDAYRINLRGYREPT